MMTEHKQTGEGWGSGVKITPPQLARLAFANDVDEFPDTATLSIEYSLSLARMSSHRLGVVFGAEVVGFEGLTALAAFRMVFELDPESPEGKHPVMAFKQIAARMAPVAMYPFVREALASIAQKSLLPPLVVPIQNVGAMWNADEVEIPDPESDEPSV